MNKLVAQFLMWLYRTDRARLRAGIRWLVARWERGEMYSPTLRSIFSKFHGVHIGMYTYGACFRVGQMSPLTRIGKYCSIAYTARAFNRNHPVEWKSTHPLFYNVNLKSHRDNLLPYIPLLIGNDVWIGHNAVILPQVEEIGDGAVIGAGAIVTRNIPPYAVVAGNPARIIRFRFPPAVISDLLAERWWEKSFEDLAGDDYDRPYVNDSGFSAENFT